MNYKVVSAAVFTVVVWASTFIAIRYTGQYFSPMALTLGRELSAAVILVIVWAGSKEGLPDPRAWKGIIIAGILWFTLYMLLLNWGEQYVDAGTASLLVKIGPLFIALFAYWFLKEPLYPNLFIGMLISLSGVAIISIHSGQQSATSLLGVLLCVIAAILDAIGIVGQKHALRYCTGLQFMTFATLISCIPLSLASGQLVENIHTTPALATITLIIDIGILGTAISYLTWSYALKRVSAGKMGATTYAVPALVILGSLPLGQNIPSTSTLLGGALCLLGVAISWHRKSWRLKSWYGKVKV